MSNYNGYKPPIEVQPEEQTQSLPIKDQLRIFRKNWVWILLGLVAALVLAYFYMKFTVPKYDVTSSILLSVTDEKKGRKEDALDQLEMFGTVSNVENETYLIGSDNIVHSVINRLNLQTSYYVEDTILDTDLYDKSPIIVDMDKGDLEKLEDNIVFNTQMLSNESLRVTGSIGDYDVDTVFSKTPALLPSRFGNISFTRRPGTPLNYSLLRVVIQHPKAVLRMYSKNLKVVPSSSTASVLELTFKTPYPEKGMDFLNTLVEVYNYEAIVDKNQEARNTQDFIEERIAIINQELSVAEASVETYKQNENLTDMQTDLQRDMQMGSIYEQQLVDTETQLNVVNSLNDYVNNPENDNKTIPTNVGIQDPTLAATTSEYNRLLLERERLSQSMTETNPALVRLNDQINGLRQNINSSVQSVQQGLQIQRRDVRNQANIFGGRIRNRPTQEREFMELAREQQIKSSLFLMLLEKREENALALAAYANKAKVLKFASLDQKVSPNLPTVILVALFLGIFIPILFIYLIDVMQYRIRTRTDVDRFSRVPVLAEVPKNPKMKKEDKSNIVVRENENNAINEAFRIARTNLLMSLGKQRKVVLFTSTIEGEGKSFVALNTAISIALLNKRVLLVGLDMRLPTVKKSLNLNVKDGITTYLSGFEEDISTLIVPSGVSDNLFVLPSGPIPPNPSELLAQDTLDKAFDALRDMFDYIIIDTPPASRVTDTILINRVADTTLYVCRSNYTSKSNLQFANQLMQQQKLKNMLLVVNSVDKFHSPYGYGYGDKKKKKKKKVYSYA